METTFDEVYNIFFSSITDDMFLEMNQSDTKKIVEKLLIHAIPKFEFPRQPLDYDLDTESFNHELTFEEKNILATYMIVEWLGQQLASVENVRMKYSGSD